MESDLHQMSDYINLMFKFADDTNLLVPQITDISVKTEISNDKSSAFENQTEINWDKTTELVFRRPNLNHLLLQDPVCSIKQVLEARLVGAKISGKFPFHSHVNFLLSVCSQAFTQAPSSTVHVLAKHELDIVYSAILVNCIGLTYVLPARAGF